ncbi:MULTISPECIES: glycerol-3-phosphate responsive antiterminator [unclassified Paenibacillus]|uniref:glycerol-3-phosphate responsive antiterminator n=1 Tax=unclassified Paenibacillus TaxID=185978 RepID=UPI001AE96DFA|nr:MULTISPECIES: glycerol-3-phosphate responsive antiterminator [unclassified Paenibacillus]MBP1157394.1 glycerol uptake operon antiterminator [Paenibacillus sp. PvP091]MBP1171868.1 glycerol uptake operon antiterminator [Paenibacillus sp. PvR098]MBP2438249.1 glycerol uptake operon antiterminator [Paenibacillus sp. PvP052]
MKPVITQSIVPAIRNMKDFDQLLKTDYEFLVLLNAHIAQVKPLVRRASEQGKKMFLHADLIEGLKSDEYATEFLAQEIRPAGIISTRNNVVLTAKKKGLIAIQRLFMLDTLALENSYMQLEKTKPDYVEVLPGIMPHIIREFLEETKIPVLAGGLIRTEEDVRLALEAGATAVTTSRKALWQKKEA